MSDNDKGRVRIHIITVCNALNILNHWVWQGNWNCNGNNLIHILLASSTQLTLLAQLFGRKLGFRKKINCTNLNNKRRFYAQRIRVFSSSLATWLRLAYRWKLGLVLFCLRAGVCTENTAMSANIFITFLNC